MKDDFRFKEPPTPPYAPVELSIANAGVKQCDCQNLSCVICTRNNNFPPYKQMLNEMYPVDEGSEPIGLGGTKHDTGKPDLSLVSSELMNALAEVREFGSKKYSRDNWKLGFKYTRSIAAALRHIMAFKDGEDLDPESGLTHISHALACLEHLLYDYKHHKGNDDRK